MRWRMRFPHRLAGRGLIVLGIVVVALLLPLRALSANGPAVHYVAAWANILAFSIAAGGLALSLLDRIRAWKPPSDLKDILEALQQAVFEREGHERAHLLGGDMLNTVAANIKFANPNINIAGDLKGVAEFYRCHTSGRLVILGTEGSGKTVLAIELLLQYLENAESCYKSRARAEEQEPHPIPVRFDLSLWNSDQPLSTWISAQLRRSYRVPSEAAKALVHRRMILPVLDGLDKMDPANASPTRANEAVEQINEYLDKHRAAPVVVTCRTGTYESLDQWVRPSVEVHIQRLTYDDIADYWHEASWGESLPRAIASERANALKRISYPRDLRLLQEVDTPWRLGLLDSYIRNGGCVDDLLPSVLAHQSADWASATWRDQICRRRVANTLLSHVIPNRVRLHGNHRYHAAKVKHWLTNIAAYLQWQGDHGQSSTDITVHRLWLMAGHDRVVQLEKTLLRSVCIIWSLGCAAASLILWIRSIDLNELIAFYLSLPAVYQVVLLSPLVVQGLGLQKILRLMLFEMEDEAEPIWEPLQVSLQQLRTHRGRMQMWNALGQGAMATLALAILTGLFLAVAQEIGFAITHLLEVYGLIPSPSDIPAFRRVGLTEPYYLDFMSGAWYGLVAGVGTTIWLVAKRGLKPLIAGSVDPYHSIRTDLVLWLAFGLAIPALAGIAGMATYGSRSGAVLALFVLGWGPLVGMMFFGRIWLRYRIATVLLANDGRLPIGLAKFLRWATKARLLRPSGASYKFQQAELAAWLLHDDPVAAPSDSGRHDARHQPHRWRGSPVIHEERLDERPRSPTRRPYRFARRPATALDPTIVGEAITDAAVIWRRGGMVAPVPTADLRTLTQLLLPHTLVDSLTDEQFTRGLEWATTRKYINQSPRLLRQGNGVWRPLERLAEDTPLDITGEQWSALLSLTSGNQRLMVAMAAHAGGHAHMAESVYREMLATEPRGGLSSVAMVGLGIVLCERGQSEEGQRLLRKGLAPASPLFSDRDHDIRLSAAMMALATAISARDRIQSEQWTRRAAEGGDAFAAYRMAMSSLTYSPSAEAGDGEALAWLEFCASLDDREYSVAAMCKLGHLARQRGKLYEAMRRYRDAIKGAGAGAVTCKRRRGGVRSKLASEYQSWGHGHCASREDVAWALLSMAEISCELDDYDGAIESYQQLVCDHRPTSFVSASAMCSLAALLAMRGESREAIRLYRLVLESDPTSILSDRVGEWFGRRRKATALFTRAARLHHAGVMVNLALISRIGDVDGATGLLDAAAEAGHPRAMVELARMPDTVVEEDTAAKWLRRAALLRFPEALRELVSRPNQDGAEDAAAWRRRLADAEYSSDLVYQAPSWRWAGNAYVAEMLKRAAELDDCDAMYLLAISVEVDLQPGEAMQWLRRAAEYNHMEAMVELSRGY